jgi:hypothetical protein
MEDGFRGTDQIALRERLFLGQQNPGPIGLRKARVRPAPSFQNRNHVEDGETLHVLRMIERQAVGDAASASVADQREGWKAEVAHHLSQFLRHGSLGIRKMVVRRRGCPAAAVGAQVYADYRSSVGELRR